MLTKYVTMVLYNYRCNKKYKTFNNYSSSYLSTQCAYYILNMDGGKRVRTRIESGHIWLIDSYF